MLSGKELVDSAMVSAMYSILMPVYRAVRKFSSKDNVVAKLVSSHLPSFPGYVPVQHADTNSCISLPNT